MKVGKSSRLGRGLNQSSGRGAETRTHESPAGASHGDESCVTRFSGGTDEKARGFPATVMKVVWQGFPEERMRSPAGSRNSDESCVASCFFSGSVAVAAGHLVSADPVERAGL